MPKKALILIADGFEEVEAVTPVDYLRRAGVEVIVAAIGESIAVTGSHRIQLNADTSLAGLAKQGRLSADAWDAVILPGGMPGASNLAASKETGALLKEMATGGNWVCAICAAPAVVLAPLGLLKGKKFTCYPGMEEKVRDAQWSADKVVVQGNAAGGGIITSRGAGTAGLFAAAIIGSLLGEAEGKKVADSVLL